MAEYKVTMHIEGARKASVEKKLKQMFPDEDVQVEKVEAATSRADRLSEAESSLEDAKSVVTELKDEMQNWYDSIPENLQNGSKASEVQEAIDALESIESDLENVDLSSVSFPGMF